VFYNDYESAAKRGQNAANNVANNVDDNPNERGAFAVAFDTCKFQGKSFADPGDAASAAEA
jgi:3-hydroxy-3-methylglutaryl CoA synthase